MTENVHTLMVRPKTEQFSYHGFTVVISFDVQKRRWKWEATKVIQTVLRYTGNEDGYETTAKAAAAARRNVDKRLNVA